MRDTCKAALRAASMALLAWAPSAHADDALRGIELAWHAPSGCPDETWARAALTGYLGRRKPDAFKPIAVRVELSSTPSGRYRAALALDDGTGGDRRFEGATCSRVADAAVLIVALMLDPVEVVAQIEAPPAVPRSEAPTSPTKAPRRAAEESAGTFDLGIEAAGDIGSLPEPSVGAGVVAG